MHAPTEGRYSGYANDPVFPCWVSMQLVKLYCLFKNRIEIIILKRRIVQNVHDGVFVFSEGQASHMKCTRGCSVFSER